jgi:hypothetical protein
VLRDVQGCVSSVVVVVVVVIIIVVLALGVSPPSALVSVWIQQVDVGTPDVEKNGEEGEEIHRKDSPARPRQFAAVCALWVNEVPRE